MLVTAPMTEAAPVVAEDVQSVQVGDIISDNFTDEEIAQAMVPLGTAISQYLGNLKSMNARVSSLERTLEEARCKLDSRKCTKYQRRQLEDDLASASDMVQFERDRITEVKCSLSSALRQRQCLLALRSPYHSKRRRLTELGSKCGQCTRWHHLGRGLGIPLPFLGCQPDALWRRWGVASRTRVESAYCHFLRSIFVNSFTTTEEKEIDHGAKTNFTSLLSTMTLCSNRLGLVMDFGDDVLHIVPCFEDYALPHTIFRWIWLAVTFLSI